MALDPSKKTAIKTLALSGLAGWLGLVAHLVWMRFSGPGDAMFWTIMPLFLTAVYGIEFALLAVPAYFVARKLQKKIHPLAALLAGTLVFAAVAPLVWAAVTGGGDLSGGNWIFFSEAGAIWGAVCMVVMSLLQKPAAKG